MYVDGLVHVPLKEHEGWFVEIFIVWEQVGQTLWLELAQTFLKQLKLVYSFERKVISDSI